MKPKRKKPLPSWSFAPIDKPTYATTLQFPENLPALSGKDLGYYHGRYVGLHAYASSELAKIQVQILRLESEISIQRHNRFVLLASQKQPKWQLDNLTETSPKVRELREALLLLQIQKETLFAYCLNFERYASALSREMSRRAAESRIT